MRRSWRSSAAARSATRAQLLGEWSDLASLFNACDVVCSSALNDGARMTLVAAMLCGVPCVATGIGAQGEVIGHHGVAIEAGSPPAFVKGIQRVLQLTPEKRAAMAQGARKHALQNYVYVRSLQRYLQLYYDLIGRQSLVSQEMPTPEIDASVPVPAKVGATAETQEAAGDAGGARRSGLAGNESRGARGAAEVARRAGTATPRSASRKLSQKIASTQSSGDVLQVFEAELAKPQNNDRAFNERARGVADESEELLSMEAIAAPKPGAARPAPATDARRVTARQRRRGTCTSRASGCTDACQLHPRQRLPLHQRLPLRQRQWSHQRSRLQPTRHALHQRLPLHPQPEPASVTQPLAALALLESSARTAGAAGLAG